MRRRMWRFIVPAAIGGMLLVITLGGFAVLLLWNWLLPPLFGWHAITFWQAVGLLALCRILFGGLGRHGASSFARRRRARAEIWERLTPEERERFRQGVRGRCGFGPTPGESGGPST